MSTELAAPLPSPVYAPEETTAEDISLPRIKVAHTGDRVKSKSSPVEYGDIISETSSDDPQPVILAKGGDGIDTVTSPPILFFLLAPVRISFSWNDKDTDEFVVAGPHDARTQAQIEAFGSKGKDKWIPRKGYNLLLALPTFDEKLPYKLLLKGMSSSAYRHLDTEVRKADQPFWEVPFHLTAKQSKRGTYEFNVFQVARADVKDADLAGYIEKVVPLVTPAHDIYRSASAIDGTDAVVVATDAPSID